jgi:hypothetical protein
MVKLKRSPLNKENKYGKSALLNDSNMKVRVQEAMS